MSKVSPEVEDAMDMEAVLRVSADVSFKSNHFPKYKLGADNQILEEPKQDNNGPSLKEVVEQEMTQLLEQHKRLSVRDLACKFDKNLTAAAKLSEEVSNYLSMNAKLREVASMEGHVLLKKLRDALEHLRGRMAGHNKDDVEKAISMLCGYRGESNTAAKALFWQARKGLSFVLTFESERDRNAAITLARKYAHDCNVTLAGPDDQV